MSTEGNRRLPSIDILKGIGIISVVVGHAMNTDNYYSISVEYVRRFVYLYHLAIFFFCSGYLLKVKPVKEIIRRFLKQYAMFFLICMSSILLFPLWIRTGAVAWNGFNDVLVKVKHILLFRQDGYFCRSNVVYAVYGNHKYSIRSTFIS